MARSVSAKMFSPTTNGIKAAGRHLFKKVSLGSGKRSIVLKPGQKKAGLTAMIGRAKNHK